MPCCTMDVLLWASPKPEAAYVVIEDKSAVKTSPSLDRRCGFWSAPWNPLLFHQELWQPESRESFECGVCVVVLGVVNLPAGNWGLSAREHIIANLYHHGVLGTVLGDPGSLCSKKGGDREWERKPKWGLYSVHLSDGGSGSCVSVLIHRWAMFSN